MLSAAPAAIAGAVATAPDAATLATPAAVAEAAGAARDQAAAVVALSQLRARHKECTDLEQSAR